MMTKKERFITAARRGIPDRIPVLINLTPQVAERIGKKWGLPYEPEDSFLSTRISHVEIVNKLGNDAVCVAACRQNDRPTVRLENGRMRDEWGIEYERIGLYDEAVFRPLAHVESVEALLEYRFPDPMDEGRYEVAKRRIREFGKEYAIVGDLEATLFELSWNLVGMEKFLMDLFTEEEYIEVLLDRVADFSTKVGVRLIELGCDMIWMGDDLGTQSGLMISPEVYRRSIKPRQAKIIKAFKDANPDIIIAYHSCGAITPIIEDLIETGVEVLNPIQPKAAGMDLAALKEKYSDRLAFFGTVDVQDVLPNGTVEDVINEVKLRIEQGGKHGGLIIAPAHNVQPDTPVENIEAILEAVEKYGKY